MASPGSGRPGGLIPPPSLLGFFALGALILALDWWRHPPTLPPLTPPDDLVHTAADPEKAARAWAEDEALYREAVRLRLDEGDLVVRRRLIQKMRFMLDDLIETPDPTDAQLNAWLAEHAHDYASPPTISLRLVRFDPNRRDNADADATNARATFAAGDPDAGVSLGDPVQAGNALTQRTPQRLAAELGQSTASAVLAMPIGQWSAPVPSPMGPLLVFITDRVDPPPTTLDTARDRVDADWRASQHTAARDAAIEGLLREHGYAPRSAEAQ